MQKTTIVNKISDSNGYCKCCSRHGATKKLWTEYNHNGNREIYGEMISECFALEFQQPASLEEEYICDICVSKLRNACYFKNQLFEHDKGRLLIEKENIIKTQGNFDYRIIVQGENLNEQNEDSINHLMRKALHDQQNCDGNEVVAEEEIIKEEIVHDEDCYVFYCNDDVTYENIEDCKPSIVEVDEICNENLKDLDEENEDSINHLMRKALHDQQSCDGTEVVAEEEIIKEEIVDDEDYYVFYCNDDVTIEDIEDCKPSIVEVDEICNENLKDLDEGHDENETDDNLIDNQVDRYDTDEIMNEEENPVDENLDDEAYYVLVCDDEADGEHDDVNNDISERSDELENVSSPNGEDKDENNDDDLRDITKIECLNFEGDEAPPPRVKSKKKVTKRSYKNYTEDQFLASIKQVKMGSSCAEAGRMFNVPRKTLDAYMRNLRKNKNMPQQNKLSDKIETHKKLIEQLKLILKYTNATPFKTTRIDKLYCAYCYRSGPLFDDPEELRIHTRKKHAVYRVKGVEIFMHPAWMNEIMRLDIHNLICVICCTLIPNWGEMFRHLDEHGIKLDEKLINLRLIPFVLNVDLIKCALCHAVYSEFHCIDAHMNTHYSNFTCDDCGDTFVTMVRLKKHMQTHIKEDHPCEVCGKTFRLEKYRKKHYMSVHEQHINVKCLHCERRFPTMGERQNHVLETHPDKVRKYNCDLCGWVFSLKIYYIAHLRKVHGITSHNFVPKNIERKKRKIKEKMSGKKKNGKTLTNYCKICKRNYSTKQYLIQHMVKAHSDKIEELAKEKQIKI